MQTLIEIPSPETTTPRDALIVPQPPIVTPKQQPLTFESAIGQVDLRTPAEGIELIAKVQEIERQVDTLLKSKKTKT